MRVLAKLGLPAAPAALPETRRRALAALAVVAAVAWVGHALIATLGVGGPVAADLSSGILHNALEFLAAGACFGRAAWDRRNRIAWLLIAAGVTSYSIGETLWYVWLGRLASPPFPSICDAFWLSFYLLAFAGLALLARERLRVSHATLWLDGAMGVLVLSSFGILALLEPVAASGQGSFAAVATNLAYPLLDLLLLALIVAVFAASAWRPGAAWATLGVGVGLLVAADSWYVWRAALGVALDGGFIDPLYALAMLVLGIAAWQRLDQPPALDRGGVRVLALPSLFVVLAAGILGYASFTRVNTVAVVCAIAVLVLVVVRTGLTFRDVRQLADTRRLALTDDLTGLPNRRHLLASLADELGRADASDNGVALLLVDLDRFKELNDTFGHHVGDLLLCQLGERVRSVLGHDHLTARLGGDEFAVVIADRAPATAAAAVAGRLLAVMQEPFLLDGMPTHVDASIGAAVHPRNSGDVATLLRHADLAMYAAKRSRSGFEPYREELDAGSPERVELVGQLAAAMEAGELVVHFQPKVDLVTGALAGVEALVRWQHPRLGLLMPGRFLPAVEQTGLIRPLTRHVLERSLSQAAAWRRAGTPVEVAVNLSVLNLLDEQLPLDVARRLERHDLPGSSLRVEVTESAVMSDPDRAATTLEALRRLGVSVALDDFGTGYSSLSLLAWLPVDEIKIDRSFVARMAGDARSEAIIRTTIELARSLDLKVVAEGVEDADQLARLRVLGCHSVQGYLLGRPVPAAELAVEPRGNDLRRAA